MSAASASPVTMDVATAGATFTPVDAPILGLADAGWSDGLRLDEVFSGHQSAFGHLPAASGGLEEAAILKSPTQDCAGCEPVSELSRTLPAAGSLILLGVSLVLGAVAIGERRQRHRHRRRRSSRR